MTSLSSDVRREGWYPDPQTGGTQYWDGRRWTGDLRPPRKRFAAQSSHRISGIILTVFGGMMLLGTMAMLGNPEMYPTANPLVQVPIGVGVLAGGIYLLRGQGPSTRSAAAHAAELRREAAFAPSAVVETVPRPTSDAVRAAQIQALADPDTAQALQNLQNLLYTHAITEAEYQAAKDKLLGN